MNLSKIARQIRREATANPKKAAVLGLLVLVALYYWGPLVWGWVTPDKVSASAAKDSGDGRQAAKSSATQTGSATPRPSQPPGPEKTRLCPWPQVVDWMRRDPRTSPADDLSGLRDPFAVARTATKAIQDQPPAATMAAASPESLAIKLAGTLVGPRRRVALIDGKAYREGETVTIVHGGQPVELKLAEVHPQRIVLAWEGKRMEVSIPAKNTAASIGVAQSTP